MLEVPGPLTNTLSLSTIQPKGVGRASSRDNGRQPAKRQGSVEIGLDDLVFRVAAAFRGHPHLNNVLTHISGANWSAVEKALYGIFDRRAESHSLSPLARNIVDLMCANRGVTGRILKPFYRERLVTLLGKREASRLIAHVTCLFLECVVAVQTAKRGALTNGLAGTNNGRST